MRQAKMVLAPPTIEFINWFANSSQDFDEAHVNTLVLNSSLTDRFTLSWY